jgi:hypothetical protein
MKGQRGPIFGPGFARGGVAIGFRADERSNRVR